MREQILDGKLILPAKDKFTTALGDKYTRLASNLFKSLWFAYLRNKGSINSVFWSEAFDNAKVFNQVLISLSAAGWIDSHSIPARNWAEMSLREDKLLEFVDIEELEQVRAFNKYRQYVLEDTTSTLTQATRINGQVKDTGITREGFMKAGNTRFQYDQILMDKHSKAIQLNLTKSMDKIALTCPNLRHDKASYDVISVEILDYHLNCNDMFTRGDNFNDSRGRAISSCLSKVANPISCKDFRALLVIPEA